MVDAAPSLGLPRCYTSVKKHLLQLNLQFPVMDVSVSSSQSDLWPTWKGLSLPMSTSLSMPYFLGSKADNSEVLWGWTDGSAIRNTAALQRTRFSFQNPHGSSQPPETPFSEDPLPSSGFHCYQTHTWYIDIREAKTSIHIVKQEDLFKFIITNNLGVLF